MSAYCTQSDIEARFGTQNVDTWSTLDSDDDAATKLARVTVAIAVASDELDEVLRVVPEHESKLPISTVPDSVEDKVAIRAGIWLYQFRADADFAAKDGFFAWLMRQYRVWLQEVRTGKRKLNIP